MLSDTQQAFLDKFGIKPKAGNEGKTGGGAAFSSLSASVEKVLQQVRALPPQGARLLKPMTEPIAHALSEARKLAAQGSEAEATKLLSGQAAELRALDREKDVVADYIAEAQGFAARITQTRKLHRAGGAAALEEYLQRLLSDDKRRQAAEARSDFDQALIACEAQEGRHSAMMQEGKRAVECDKLRTAIETEIARLESQAAGGGNAKPIIAQVREMMNDADNFTKSDNWVGATMMMRKARTELQVGTRGLELMDKLRPTEEDKEFKRAYGQVTALLAALQKIKAKGPVKRELTKVVHMTRDAKAALPDENQAMHLLHKARAACTDLTQNILENGRYATSFKQLRNQRDQLKQTQIDKCVQGEIARISRLLREADQLSRRLDFPGALKSVDSAGDQIRIGTQAARLYAELVRPARVALARQIKSGDTPEATGQLSALDSAFRSRDLRTAERLARAVDAA